MPDEIKPVADKYGTTPSLVFIRFMMGLGMIPVIETLSKTHIAEYLSAQKLSLTMDDVAIVLKSMDTANTSFSNISKSAYQRSQRSHAGCGRRRMNEMLDTSSRRRMDPLLQQELSQMESSVMSGFRKLSAWVKKQYIAARRKKLQKVQKLHSISSKK
eukprot:gnl/TRDRNA2_/TRDRNA2_89060_c0_seq1.p1 gnl/TRDRNA2_/TRDRNA2_89060_c0~~gnl/TRDRNA2_/TRDRNA2_89060_c0_seq1.p1  ORF type:complete len:158 (+),score=14.14 gnl/TRDRNA2_/TRDRNA2_89060_c0_seq1:2-475(+)